MVYIGDGLWDIRASRSLGIPFIGVGRGEREKMLRAAGAKIVVPDFQDIAGFLNKLEEVKI